MDCRNGYNSPPSRGWKKLIWNELEIKWEIWYQKSWLTELTFRAQPFARANTGIVSFVYVGVEELCYYWEIDVFNI